MRYHQKSLESALLLNNSIIRSPDFEHSFQSVRLPLYPLTLSISGNRKSLPVSFCRPYAGHLQSSSSIIFNRKYILHGDMFLAEGLTFGDYTININSLDPNSWSLGCKIVENNSDISINTESLLSNSISCNYPCNWIGGDSIDEINYSHWIFEHLLKFEVFRLCGFDMSLPFILSSRLPKSFTYWSDLFIGENLNYEFVDLSQPQSFQSLNVTSTPLYREKVTRIPHIWLEGFQLLRKRFLQLSSIYPRSSSVPHNSVIFLTRGSAKWRFASKQDDLFNIVDSHFDCDFVDISKLSPIAQVQMLSTTKILFLFGGADGIACNFLNPTCRVIEILAPTHLGTLCSQIYCAIHGISYTRIHGKKYVSDQNGPAKFDRDFIVDIDEFTSIVRSLKSQSTCT